jgi:hypothetical protein
MSFTDCLIMTHDLHGQAAEWGVGALAGNPDEDIPEGEESARLAVLDLDWDHVSAVDVLALLRSFLAKV